MQFTQQFLTQAKDILNSLHQTQLTQIENMVSTLSLLKHNKGRLFILGVGGSAANASHAVNDFRKIAGIEAYAPTDNIAELTARINDDGWTTVFSHWLEISRLAVNDILLIFSVGGGNIEHNISPSLISALRYAKTIGAKVLGIVGRDGGYTATVAECCVIIPSPFPDSITPHTEAFQAIIWHLLVTHPSLKKSPTKWESIKTQFNG